MKSGLWIGLDPGGSNKLALSYLRGKTAESCRVSSIADALNKIEEEPLGIGIDAPLWWSARKTGIRKADKWIQEEYDISQKTVQAVNSMWGSVIVQGMLFAAKIRERFPDVNITESHPKALRMASGLNSAAEWLRERSIVFETENDDELDATIAAICAREGFSGNWDKDLASDRFPEEQDPKNQWFGPVYYFWP